jgi:hypothetical protein
MKILGWCVLVSMISPVFADAARAQQSDAEYLELLAIAQKSVERRREAREQRARARLSRGLGATQVARLGLNRKFYEKGQSWRVVFTPSADPAVAAIVRKELPGTKGGTMKPTEFEYSVLDASTEEARIQVKQLPGGAPLDARVDHVVLTIASDFVPRRKEIFYRDGRAPVVLVYAAEGPLAMGFEATPLELPNLSEDEGEAVRDGGVPALRFQTQDLFARPVEAVWREGEAWPAEVKTVAGVARLKR